MLIFLRFMAQIGLEMACAIRFIYANTHLEQRELLE